MSCHKKRRLKRAVPAVKADSFGYTLMEMLLVVLILAIIISISMPYASTLVVKSKERSDVAAIRRACAKYEADFYVDGEAVMISDGCDVESFIGSVITSEEVKLNYNNDGGFGAMPIKVENGCAYITYKPRHADDDQQYSWRLKLADVSFEDEARAPSWTPTVPPVPEPADP